MNNWEYELAEEIREGRKKPITGVCIGTVTNTNPFQVSIQNGNIILDKENACICNQLLERNSKAVLKGSHTQSGTLNGNSYNANGNIEIDGNIVLLAVWQKGDKVLVIPSGDGQKFFIVDIIREV